MALVGILAAIVTLVFVVAMAEALRTLAAHALKLRPDRWFGVMQLPASAGSKGRRIVVALAGSFGGYLATVVLAFALFRVHGVPVGNSVVADALEGFDAAGKVIDGDRIVGVDGETHANIDATTLGPLVRAKNGAPIELAVERDGKRVAVTITPKQVEGAWRLGILFRPVTINDAGTVVPRALAYPVERVRDVVRGIADVFTGSEEVDPGGPTRIVREFKQPAHVLPLLALIAVYGLLCLLVLDLVRVILVLVRRS